MNDEITKSETASLIELENATPNIAAAIASLKQSLGDLQLFDDISIEADVEQAGPRAKSHFRFRAYRRSGG